MNEMNDDDIVITGISGRFPESDNIEEFWNNLMNGVELGTADDRRWPVDFLGLPPRAGKLKNIQQFDAEFFNYNQNDANYMDPQFRILHEVVYEAIWDAGIIPDEIRGTKTALLVGYCYDDTTKALQTDLSILDLKRTYGAPQVAYFFDFRGPSFSVDTACASSFSAFNEGIRYMRKNQVENIIIAGVTLHLIPAVSKGFTDMRMISKEGRSKCLDAAVDGYCRSEAIGALFLQKRRHAKRIYASLITCRTNSDGFKPEGITFPGFETQVKLLKETLIESRVDPLSIEYIEAHVTGTAAGDPVESRAILEAYRRDSKKPIMFGCLKSNMGHSEGSSSTCSITKVALIFQKRCIPPNINFKNPNPNIEGLSNNTIIPVIKKRAFNGDIIPVNSFGFGGVNVHALFKANEKVMSNESSQITDNLPRLVNVAGRNTDNISHVFEWLKTNRKEINNDFLTLLNDVSKVDMNSGMHARGYCLLDSNKTILKKTVRSGKSKRPIWFVFSALGCQWKAMAKGLLQFQPFKRSIEVCAHIVNELNINLMNILLDDCCDLENDIVNAIISITCMQIALVDILTYFGIIPDGIIGHSLGEVAAGYADGCLSIREAIFTAYYIAKCSLHAQKGKGSMAAVGLSWENAVKRCPTGVYPGCDNFDDTVTVTGEMDKVAAFVSQLQNDNVFAKEVQSCSIAFHCPMVYDAHQSLVENISQVISVPKKRSNRWLTTSAESEEVGGYCNGEYFANNVIKSVKFNRALKRIPKDACVVEVGPHALLLSIVRRHVESKTSCIAMMKRNSSESLIDILSSVGEVYCNGHNPKIEKLYPKIVYPVARETASLSQLLQWNHTQNYFVCKFPEFFDVSKDMRSQKVDLIDHKMKFLGGHCIDGRNLFPATGYLYYVWQQLGWMTGFDNIEAFTSDVEFRNVKFHRALIIPKVDSLDFNIEINKETGKFYVIEGDTICVSGYISNATGESYIQVNTTQETSDDVLTLSQKDIYKELRVRGYDYGVSFQGLVEAKADATRGLLKWTGHWISFTDSMLHLSVLASKDRTLCVPTYIEYLRCDTQTFFNEIKSKDTFDVVFDKEANIGVSVGLIVKGLEASPAPRKQDLSASLDYFEVATFDKHVSTKEFELTKINTFYDNAMQLIRKLYEKQYDVSEEQRDSFVLQNNPFLEKLFDCLLKQQSFEEFIGSLTNEEKQFFVTETNVDLVLRDQLQVMIDNLIGNVAKVIEYNSTITKVEEIFESLMKSFIKKSEYKLLPTDLDNKMTVPGVSNDIDFIIYKDSNTSLITDVNDIEDEIRFESFLNSSFKVLKPGGFLLLLFRDTLSKMEIELLKLQKMNYEKKCYENYEHIAKQSKFKLISKKTDDLSMVSILLRKLEVSDEVLKNPIVINTNFLNYEWLNELKLQLNENGDKRIWLKANSDEYNGVHGLTKCLRKEPNGHRIRCIVSNEEKIESEVLEKDLAYNFIKSHKFGSLCARRVNQSETVRTAHAYIDIKTKGDLSSFHWFESPHKYWPTLPARLKSNKLYMAHIYYSALNFKDVMVATGRIPTNAYPSGDTSAIALEFSGIDENGNRIFGFCSQCAIATTIMLKIDDFYLPIPDEWSFEEASTVTIVYITVYYALFIRGKLRPGETVLIHAGSGGVGQAAIRVCLAQGCKVFTSVGTQQKKQFLKDMFPQLEDHNFVNSRETTFEEHILKYTNGRGVDLILNSLAEEKQRASINCLADYGRFLEIGKYDLIQNSPFESQMMDNNKQIQIVCVAHLIYESNTLKSAAQKTMCDQIKQMLKDGIKNGEVKPLPRVVFERDEVEKAFRYMAAGKHIGKVLIKIRDETETIDVNRPLMVDAIPQTSCHPLKVYVLVGGLGGIGLELAHWLTQRGAKKLVFTSRVGVQTVYQKYAIQKLQENGVIVKVIVNNATSYESALSLVNECMELGKIGGIFNLAMVLSDFLLENQTVETYEAACQPKVNTTLYLDKITRQLCPDLDYFVCYSSLACGRGNAGQSNYGFANSVMESICEKRRDDKLHGLAIEWGAVGDVGFVLENFKSNDVVIAGSLPQRMPSCLQALDIFINQPKPVCTSVVLAGNSSSGNAGKGDLLKSICHVLGVTDPNSLDENITIAELGMDSLMAVEIKQGLERDYNVVLSTPEIRNLTVKRIREISKKKVVTEKVETKDEMEEDDDVFAIPSKLFTRLDTNNQGVPIFFVPPIEGNFKLMRPLVKYISRPVVAINWVEELDDVETIEGIASFYVKKLQEEYPLTEYDIVGYSLGALIAHEMCIQLQKVNKRLVKKMINLDGAYDYLKHFTIELIQRQNVSSEIGGFREVLIYFTSVFHSIKEVEQVSRILYSTESKEEMIAKCCNFFKLITNKDCDATLLTKTANRYFNKLRRVYAYSLDETFSGDIKLITSNDSTNMYKEFQKKIDGNLQVINKDGDHKSFLASHSEDLGNYIESQLFFIHS